MAYNVQNLTTQSGNMKNGVVPSFWTFWNEDTDTVTGADYFDDKRLVVGDIVQVLSADFTALIFYRVSAVSANGEATVLILTSVTP